MEGVILIASSYKIIKRSQKINEEETQLASIDLKTYTPTESVDYDDYALDDNPLSKEDVLKNQVKKEMEEELEALREEFLAQTKLEMDSLEEAAYQEGLAKGTEEGKEAGREEIYKELDTLRMEALNKVLDAEQLAKVYLEEHEERILKLAGKIAEKIINVTLDDHEESLMLLARPILEEYGKTENVIISCHPEKVSFIKSYLPEMEKLCPNARILVLEDKNLDNHDMIIENENQITDLTISRQIERFLELATG